MDAFQIGSLALLAAISIVQVAALVIVYRAIVRHEESTKVATKTADFVGLRLVEIESTMKRTAPAIERLLEIDSTLKSSGSAIERSSDQTSMQIVEANGLLRSLTQSMQEAVAESKALHREMATRFDFVNVRVAKAVESLQQTETALDGLRQLVTQVHMASRDGVFATNSNTEMAQAQLDRLTAEIAGLRSDLKQATQF